MPDYDLLLASPGPGIDQPIDSASRAVDAWRRILDRPVAVTLKRGQTNLAAQTIRVEVMPAGGQAKGDPSGNIGFQGLVVYGIQDHPTEPDTDIRRGDRFLWDGKMYEITGLIKKNGEIQAFGEVRS